MTGKTGPAFESSRSFDHFQEEQPIWVPLNTEVYRVLSTTAVRGVRIFISSTVFLLMFGLSEWAGVKVLPRMT